MTSQHGIYGALGSVLKKRIQMTEKMLLKQASMFSRLFRESSLLLRRLSLKRYTKKQKEKITKKAFILPRGRKENREFPSGRTSWRLSTAFLEPTATWKFSG